MRAERLGSYSIAVTLPGTSSLFRLKSISRYSRLLPPPRWRDVMRPEWLRPPLLFSDLVNAFSGSVLVISAKVETVPKRRPGEVGLYCLSAIVFSGTGVRLLTRSVATPQFAILTSQFSLLVR